MNALDPQLPPLALALGRLRQPRPAPRTTWPFAPRPAGEPLPEETPPPAATATAPDHDFLRVLPEPALTGELPTARSAPPPAFNRPYWFDL
jgi:hypothetical protein